MAILPYIYLAIDLLITAVKRGIRLAKQLFKKRNEN